MSSTVAPPCQKVHWASSPDWGLWLENTVALTGDEVDKVFADRPVLSFPHGGPQLAIVEESAGLLRAVGRYRPDSVPVRMEVRAGECLTRLLIPADEPQAVRWADYAARVFFASRMLADGWRMLHASAIALDGTAVLFLADQEGGKSTLAHRACVELGAGFLADDLVLISAEGMVVGWPTRIAVPAELVRNADETSGLMPAIGQRRRVAFTPVEHRSVSGIEYSPPVPLGALVCIQSDQSATDPLRASVLAGCSRESFVVTAADVPAQHLFVSDLVGLMGGPRSGSGGEPVAGTETSWQVPAVLLTVGDMAGFARAPVWEVLAPLLSEFGER
ncbi:hypothetical protein [Lipingzhangella rawalii]|uniref:hypothetical protein n=1 Tax=Lipingzhangella rawalii TaxID=2055835 RepID=UPI00287B7053|nr:hypothetical protein [Lipingzhangella rawalii]